jgi:hypothetical protein
MASERQRKRQRRERLRAIREGAKAPAVGRRVQSDSRLGGATALRASAPPKLAAELRNNFRRDKLMRSPGVRPKWMQRIRPVRPARVPASPGRARPAALGKPAAPGALARGRPVRVSRPPALVAVGRPGRVAARPVALPVQRRAGRAAAALRAASPVRRGPGFQASPVSLIPKSNRSRVVPVTRLPGSRSGSLALAKPNSDHDPRKNRSNCKERPASNRPTGSGSRAFIPWCSRK